jgi:hypothetical protein
VNSVDMAPKSTPSYDTAGYTRVGREDMTYISQYPTENRHILAHYSVLPRSLQYQIISQSIQDTATPVHNCLLFNT